ncbi:hypothetical protein TorRG33x02_049550, partial [Trema orientale]
GKHPSIWGVPVTQIQPFVNLHSPLPTRLTNPFHHEAKISRGHLNPPVVQHIGHELIGLQSQNPVTQILDSFSPIFGSLESQFVHFLSSILARPPQDLLGFVVFVQRLHQTLGIMGFVWKNDVVYDMGRRRRSHREMGLGELQVGPSHRW